MSAFDPLIESWFYADLDSVRTLTIDEGGGNVVLTNASAALCSAALDAFETAANASGSLSNAYTFTLDEDAGTVTLAADATTAFALNGSLAAYWGFSNPSLTGAASYASDQRALGFYVPLAVDFEIPRPAEDGKLLEFRSGRARANVWHQTHALTVRIKGHRADIEAHLDGPIFRGGLVRIYVTTDRAAAFGYTNRDGYIQASIYGIKSLRTIGQAEELAEVELDCQLEVL